MNRLATTKEKLLGPVLLEILHGALTAVSEEMSVAVRRTSRSTTVREMLDYSTAIFDADGRNVAQATSANFDVLFDHVKAPAMMENT